MDEIHKTILHRYRVGLVKTLEPSKLYDALFEKGVFTQDIIDEIKRWETRRDQSRQLVLDLEKRGSRAFPLFLECLQETGQHRLVELLQNGAPTIELQPPTPIKPQPPPPIKPLPSFEDRRDNVPEKRSSSTPSPPPEMEYMKPDPASRIRRDSSPIYKMDASPCGHCLIINNVEFEPQSELNDRKGSNIDCDKMERRFKALNFIVEVKTNLKQRQIKHKLLALSKMDHSQYDCCVVIMLSHGTEGNHNRFPGAVYGVDGQYVLVQEMTNYLNGQNCPSLQGKPKLFFIQACGGDERDTGFEVSTDELEPSIGGADDETDSIPLSSSSDSLSMSDEPDARATLPNLSDFLVSYSTSPGYVSWRDTQSGSWYIETLDRILEENAANSDLASILMMVNHNVSQNSAKGLYKQIPGFFTSLRKHLYFQTSS